MSDTELACRYARALFAMSEARASTQAWLGTLKAIVSVFATEKPFKTFCQAPQLDFKIKMGLIEKAFAPFGEPILVYFLGLLLRKRRLQLLPEIYAAYVQLADAAAGRLPVRFVTALPLEESREENREENSRERLKLSLESKLQKNVYITHEINPALLAGAVVEIGNKRLDASLQGKLLRLKKYLLQEDA